MSSAIINQQVSSTGFPGAGSICVLVVSPNKELRCDLLSRLQSSRWSVQEASSGAAAIEKIISGTGSLILLDPALPDLRVDEFRQFLAADYPGIEVIPINSHTGRPMVAAPPDTLCFDVVRAMERSGPFTLDAGAFTPPVTAAGGSEQGLPGVVGSNAAMQRVCAMARLVAQRDTTVLITGESGTGKDLIARALHSLSLRRHKPFVVINCAAIPESLLEAELFGFVKGAFTGAVQSRVGRIHSAQGGTLFLDEIGDLPLGLQSKLLRFLEEGEIQRLGSTDTFRVDVRVVAATNANLRRMVQEHNFREDLFYRLSVFPIELPALRDRMSDLQTLIQTFLAKFCARDVVLSPEATTLLQQHTWPGNVREVRNVIERASILIGSGNQIKPEHILI